MEEPILDPPIPYVGPVPGGIFSPGRIVKIQGVVPRTAYRFNINLQCGRKTVPRDDIGMQVSVRVVDGYVALNSLQNGTWGEEQYCLTLPIERGERFEIGLKAHPSTYEVVVNGQHFCDFPQRIRCTRITHLTIDGDVSIIHISYTSAGRDNVAAPGGGVGWVPQATAPRPTVQIQNEIDGFEPINSNSASTPPPSYDVVMKQKNQIGFASADTPAAGPPYPTSAPYPPTGSSSADTRAAGPPYPTSAPYPSTGSPYPPTGAPYPTESSPTNVPGTGHTTPYQSSFESRVRPNITAYSISGRAQVPYPSGDLETGHTTSYRSSFEPRVSPDSTAYSISGRAQAPYPSGDPETGHTTSYRSSFEPRVRPDTTAYSISSRAQAPYRSGDLDTVHDTIVSYEISSARSRLGALVPLNAASSNFRPVQSKDSRNKGWTAVGGIIFALILVIFLFCYYR